MKIAVSINEIVLKQKKSGVKRYTYEIVKALSRIDKENKYILYASRENNKMPDFRRFIDKNKNFKIKIAKSAIPFWMYMKFPREIKKDNPDVLFMPIQSTPYFFKKPRRLKIIITIHDVAFIRFPDYFTTKRKILLNFHTKRAIKMADYIISPSYKTKNDIIKFYGANEEKIKVIYHGISLLKDSNKNDSNDIECDLKINSRIKSFEPYILFVGTIQPRKNIEKLIEAFEIIKKGVTADNLADERLCFDKIRSLKLLICGQKGWLSEKIYKKAKESKFSKFIIFIENAEDDYLAKLYKNALIFILPSLYEGFGMPLLEAMKFGIPTIASNNSSLSEIANESALLVNEKNSGDIAEKISILLSDDDVRTKFSKKGLNNAKKFNWTKSARETLEVFKL